MSLWKWTKVIMTFYLVPPSLNPWDKRSKLPECESMDEEEDETLFSWKLLSIVPVVLLTMLYEVDATFQSVDEILKCGHSSESYWAVLSVRRLVILCQVLRNFKPLYWWRIAIYSRCGISTVSTSGALFTIRWFVHISLVPSDRFPKIFKRGYRALSVLFFVFFFNSASSTALRHFCFASPHLWHCFEQCFQI